jgi:hypothetical protein
MPEEGVKGAAARRRPRPGGAGLPPAALRQRYAGGG